MKKENRVDNSIIFVLEHKLGIPDKIVKSIPPFITPRTLNTAGFIFSVLAFVCLFLTRFSRFWFIGAIIGISLYFFCDRYDGRLARYTKTTSKRGYYADHMFDCLSTFFILFGLGLSGNLNMVLALLLVILYYILSIEVHIMTFITNNFKPTFFCVGPAEALTFIIFSCFAVMFIPEHLILFSLFGFGFTLFNLLAVLAIGIILYGVIYTVTKDFIYMEKFEAKFKVKTIWEWIEDL